MYDIFFGAGGHGCVGNFGSYLFHYSSWTGNLSHRLSPTREFWVLMAPIDSGGSTGTQYDLVHLNNGELNALLHGDKAATNIPFGDTKQLVISSLTAKHPHINWNNVFNLKTDDLKTQLSQFNLLSSYIQAPTDLWDKSTAYFTTYITYLNQNKSKLNPQRIHRTSFGNLWLSFLFHISGHKGTRFNSLLHSLELLPEWVHVCYFADYKLTIEGIDIAAETVVEEDIIDEWQLPILPQTLQVFLENSLNWPPNPQVIALLKNLTVSDKIILTPGSDANWLGILQHPHILPYLQQKNIHWVQNPFHGINEAPAWYTQNVLAKNNIKPYIYNLNTNFITTKLQQEEIKNHVYNYQKDNKKILNMLYSSHTPNLLSGEMEPIFNYFKEEYVKNNQNSVEVDAIYDSNGQPFQYDRKSLKNIFTY